MFFKWTGGLLILFAGSGMGVWLAWGYKKRLQTLETLRRMVYCLKGEIVYSHAPLEEAFERIGRREKGIPGELFIQTAERIGSRTGENFAKIWEKTIEEMEKSGNPLFLEKEDKEKLLSLGGQLGYLDTQMQERTLLLYLEQLELSISGLRGEIREKMQAQYSAWGDGQLISGDRHVLEVGNYGCKSHFQDRSSGDTGVGHLPGP